MNATVRLQRYGGVPGSGWTSLLLLDDLQFESKRARAENETVLSFERFRTCPKDHPSNQSQQAATERQVALYNFEAAADVVAHRHLLEVVKRKIRKVVQMGRVFPRRQGRKVRSDDGDLCAASRGAHDFRHQGWNVGDVLDQIVEIEFASRIVAGRQRTGDIAQNGRPLAREAITTDVSLDALVAA